MFDARFLNVHFPPSRHQEKVFPFFYYFYSINTWLYFGQLLYNDFIYPQNNCFVCLFVCCFVLGQNKEKIIGTTTHSQFYDFLQFNVNVKKKKTIFNSFIPTSTPAEKKENDVKELTLNLMMIKVYIWYCVRVCHVLYMSYLLQKKNKSWFIKLWNIKINLLFHILQFHAKPKSLILCRCNINLIICWRMV